MRKFVLLFIALAIVGGLLAWKSLAGDPTLAIDEDDAKQAIEDGTGASEVRLANAVDWQPTTLSKTRKLLGQDVLQGAQIHLEEYVASYPEDGAGFVLLAEVQRRQSQLSEAKANIERGVELLPTVGHVHYVHARVLATILEEVATKGGVFGKAKAMKQVGPYRNALRTAVELDPGNFEACREEVLLYVAIPGLKDAEKALELAQAMQARHPMHGTLTTGRALFYGDRQEEGLAMVRKAVEEFPESNEPSYVLGFLLFDNKDYEGADKALTAVIAHELRDETYYQSLYRRMRVRTRSSKGSEEVLAFVDEYLQANPQWEWAPRLHQVYCEQGRALRDLGRHAEARAALNKSLELNPDFKRAKKALNGLPE